MHIRVHLWWVSRWTRRLLVVTGARCPLKKPMVTAVELQAAIEPHCSRGVQPGGIYAYVVHSASRLPEARRGRACAGAASDPYASCRSGSIHAKRFRRSGYRGINPQRLVFLQGNLLLIALSTLRQLALRQLALGLLLLLLHVVKSPTADAHMAVAKGRWFGCFRSNYSLVETS